MFELPSYDTHFNRFRESGGYQPKVAGAAMVFAMKYDLAIDIGAHVGFFSAAVARYFNQVVAFEPRTDNFLALKRNVPSNVLCFNSAVGKARGRCGMHNPSQDNSGAWEMVPGNDTDIVVLDEFSLKPNVIKIDVQGAERDVLEGARETLLRYKPVLIVECVKGGVADPAPGEYLAELGAKPVMKIGKDVVFLW